MVAAARHDAILRELELRGTLSNAAFAQRLGVSMMTVRRDVRELELRGLLRRVHGGAASLAVDEQQRRAAGGDPARLTRPVATIGMIVPTAQYYFPDVIRGASEAAHDLNVRLVVGATNYSPDEEVRQAERMIASGVDALMITPHDSLDATSELLRVLAESALPVALVERTPDPDVTLPLDWVRSDHAAGAETAIRHLHSLGHRRIMLAARPAVTVTPLLEGFLRVPAPSEGMSLWHPLSTPAPGANVMMDDIDDLLIACRADDITAAIVLGDADAMAVADRAIAHGLTIPDDLSLIAYDDEISAHAAVPITAVAPPKRELGGTALRLLFDRLRHRAPRAATRMILLPALVVRESTRAITSRGT